MSGEQRGYAEENAVICLVQEVENKYLLLVTGTEEAALVNAGIAFGNTDYMMLLDTDTVRVAKEDDFLVKPPVQGPYYFLTEYKTTVKGLFRQSAQFTVEFPAGKKLAESCELSLDFRYSSNLDFDKSLVSVCINDVPIGSRMLTREGADNTTEVFTIPPDIEIYGDFQVEIIFDFQAGDEWCRLTPEDTPWAVILDTSMLKLTAVDNMSLSFENFPAPFVRDGSMNNLQIIMPDENKDEDMQVMAGLLLTMGRYLKDNRGSLAVKKVEDAYSAEANRIVIGKLGGENLRDELNLPVSVNSGMAFLRRSAYGEESEAVLTITGEGAGMLHTLNYFGNTERLWEIKGDTFLTDGESLYCYRMTPETDEPAAPEAASESVSQKGPMLLIAISISCLVLLASVMLLIKYGRRESDENKRNNLAADISYIALLLLLFVCIVYIAGFAEHVTYSIVVLCMIFAVMIITHFTSLTLGLIFNITAIFGAATFIIYHIWSRGTAVSSEIYFWMIMSPVLTAVSYAVFYNMGELEAENERLNAYIRISVLLMPEPG